MFGTHIERNANSSSAESTRDIAIRRVRMRVVRSEGRPPGFVIRARDGGDHLGMIRAETVHGSTRRRLTRRSR